MRFINYCKLISLLLLLCIYLLTKQMEVIMAYAVKHSLGVSIPNDKIKSYEPKKKLYKRVEEEKCVAVDYYCSSSGNMGTGVVEKTKHALGYGYVAWEVALKNLDKKLDEKKLEQDVGVKQEKDDDNNDDNDDDCIDLKELDEKVNHMIDLEIQHRLLDKNKTSDKKRYIRCKCSECQAWRLKMWS